MLCEACDEFRFPKISAITNEAATSNVKSSPSPARSEVLYFIQNKSKALPFDSVVSICSDFYTLQEIESARCVLLEHLSNSKRIGKHTGAEDVKRRKTIQDIVMVCLDATIQLPAFYSLDMSRIPAVGVEHVDVSALLQELRCFACRSTFTGYYSF